MNIIIIKLHLIFLLIIFITFFISYFFISIKLHQVVSNYWGLLNFFNPFHYFFLDYFAFHHHRHNCIINSYFLVENESFSLYLLLFVEIIYWVKVEVVFPYYRMVDFGCSFDYNDLEDYAILFQVLLIFY